MPYCYGRKLPDRISAGKVCGKPYPQIPVRPIRPDFSCVRRIFSDIAAKACKVTDLSPESHGKVSLLSYDINETGKKVEGNNEVHYLVVLQ